ncbi:uncharacterized protein LOC131946140 isoform X2 [Physella acuta]|uniref:uncharacterized protein LOC131946140 isoform X2 n=1 Tax=Physella acuta TaxID=109671 RepID=UPI0027DC9B60|nr:uncharacterized protein LOC131946140 isoform X2 [Physella acuta]
MDALISPSLSSDSELGSPQEGARAAEQEVVVGDEVGVGQIGSQPRWDSGSGDFVNGEAGKENTETSAFVNNLIDFDIEKVAPHGEVPVSQGEVPPTQPVLRLESIDLFSDTEADMLGADLSSKPQQTGEHVHQPDTLTNPGWGGDAGEEPSRMLNGVAANGDSNNISGVTQADNLMGEDILQNHSPFDLLCPNNVDSPMDVSSMPASGQASGQGSKVPSYPDTPPNSYMEPSGAVYYKETQLPSFNSSEMVQRIQAKKAALGGHGGSRRNKGDMFEEDDGLDGLCVAGEGSSGGGGSLISPAVPQNSYIDLSSGFSYSSSDYQLPKLTNSDIMDRVNEKRSQFEWLVDSLDGSTSGVDVGPNSDEPAAPTSPKASQPLPLRAAMDPQVPYTPQNSYVEGSFDSYAWNNLPSMNNAEMVAKIKAKQSAMYGSSATSGRVSRNSHGSDDSGGCRSPDVAVRGSKCTSLDSPQPFTPQNSYKDNLHLLDSRNRLPDLNEVAERLSVEHSTKRQFAGSGGGSRDEENINLNAVPQNPTRQARHSSSQSDSQNTMSDVESLMSISTDVGTPSDNVVALNLAGLMRNEIAMLSRKDTADSDVFVKLDDTTLAASETKKTGVYFTDSPPKGITFAEQVATSADDGDVAHNGFPGDKELFSPVEESQLRSVEDHAFFQAAESLVAQSVAAAIQASKRQAEREASGRGGRLKWDVTTIVNFADHEEEEEDVSYTNDKSEEEDEEEDISYKVDNRNDNKSEEEYENEGFRHSDDDFTPVDDALLTADNFEEEPDEQHDAPEIPLVNGLDPHVSEHAGADSCDQQLTDLALNELAFEIANELIQNVLNNFNPETMEMEPKPYVGKRDEEVSRRVKWGDSNESAARVPIEALLEESAERRAALDANCSSSSDRSKPKDYDSPFTIVEDEVLTSFPERKPSTELISAEEEEASYSFPGRKFSKSDDFPTRRFSREDNSSRRSSRMDDSDVSVKPEDLETDYLPSMDPLQGNLDIIDASFTKMTDADREVVEGESFRKASGEEGLNREDSEDIELDEESIEEGYRRRIGEEAFDERFVDEVIPEDRIQEDTVPEVPFELKNETLEAVKRSAAKTKKRIRVSFSEDFDDEVGDFNVQLSTRSSLRSPPPPLYTQDSTSSPPDGADDEEEDDLPNFSSASAALKSDLRHNGEEHGSRAEVWNTTVGRISIASEDGESSGRTPSARGSELGEPRHPAQQSQVGELIQSAEETISTADQSLLGAALPSPAHQPVLSNHYHDPTSLEYNNSSSSPPSAVPVTSDPSLTSVFPPAQTPLASSVNNLEPHVITSNPTQPPVHVSPLVPATSDPLNTIRHHARNTSLGSIKGAVYTEEWQDDEIEEVAVQGGLDAPPMDSLRKKIVPDSSFLQAIAADDDEGVDQEGEDEDEEPDNESETGDLEWENDTPVKTPPRPGLDTTLTQGTQGEGHQRWKRVSVSGVDFNIDMQAVEPYKNVLSHGGYYAEGLNAIIVFYGCHLPSRRREDYTYIMNHLFHYVIYTLEELVADDYVIIYFHGSTPRRQMPGLGWLKRCYQSIDRRLKKNLKGLFLVHPTLWLKTIVTMIRPFISSKFSSKLRFVRSLEELNSLVPMVNVTIPEAITQLEEILKHNPHYLEEQEEEEKKMMKEEEKASKQREKERKREEKDRKKLEEDRKKLEAKEEKQKKKEEKEREKEKKKAEQKRKSQLK